jgi:Zn-dependent protease with chaperone function
MQQQCAGLPYNFKVHYQSSPQFNAVALPGGHIFVFSGLFNAAAAENELAFVLAHEMGHYANRDHLKAMGRGFVLLAVSTALFGADSGLSGFLGNGLSLTELSFSRAQETRADEFALAALNCTYGHVGGALEFMRKFPKEADPGKVGHYFSSHPEIERRIGHLVDTIESEQLPAGALKPLPAALLQPPSE